MKSLLTALASLALATAGYSATTVGFNSGVFSNPNFTSGGLIVNSNGTSLGATGRYALAYVTDGTLEVNSTTAVGDILSQLTLASAVGSMTSGFLNASVTNADPGNALLGKQIYVLMGNNATILSSTAAALYTAGTLFPLQDGAGNATSPTINVRNDAGLVFGATAVATGITAPFASVNGSTSVALTAVNNLVPEPSAALLGAIGVLGLLRRRRI